VSDTGHGMPKDVCNRWGTETARTTKEGGSGLGSRIVAGIISRHSGTISVRSETGRGSVFTIRLPVHGTETSVQENVDAVV
jgi:signal transduction histidine kinase